MRLPYFLRRLLGQSVPEHTTAMEVVLAPSHDDSPKTTDREVFNSPRLLADWVGTYIIASIPLEDDYSLLPDAETRQDLEISADQRDRCLREYTVLRVAGASLFIKQHYPDEFWLPFMDYVLPHLLKHIQSTGHVVDRNETREALETYVEAASSADAERCANFYMRRLYDDSPAYIRMKLAGIGSIANKQILSMYEIFRNAYCQVTKGMSYEAYEEFSAAIEKISKDET